MQFGKLTNQITHLKRLFSSQLVECNRTDSNRTEISYNKAN